MPVQFNHTIVEAHDKRETAEFLSEVLGVAAPVEFGPFHMVSVANGVTLDVVDAGGPIHSQHYAFLVSDEEFDEIFGRITDRGIDYWADPFHREPGRINHNDGGKGVYWPDPNGHNLEIITVPYGG